MSTELGVFELTDQAFINIKNDLLEYENSFDSKLRDSPETVLIDLSSLTKFITHDKTIKEIDCLITTTCNADTKPIEERKDLAYEIEQLNYFGIRDISELSEIIKEKRPLIEK